MPDQGKQYTIDKSDTTQDGDCACYIDLVISPAVTIGTELADMLYGDGGQGEMQLNTLYQDPDGNFTHVELRTSPRWGRDVLELGIMLERLRMYLNDVDKTDPRQLWELRHLSAIDKLAAYQRDQEMAR